MGRTSDDGRSTMARTTSDQLLERLHAWGVRRIYGYPGDGINGLMGAFGRIGDRMRFIQARHEELAAFMACAHAKFTGEVGVCMATSGPGRDPPAQRPVRRQGRPPAGASPSSASRRAPRWAATTSRRSTCSTCSRTWRTSTCTWRPCPAQMRHLVDRAMRIAIDQRTVTCIILPNDLQELEAVETPPREHGTVHSGIGRTGHARRARRGRPARAPPTCSTPGRRWRSSSAPARCTPPTSSSRSPTCSAPAWPRRCWARSRCPTTCPTSPAPSACSAPRRAGR